jgi:hypothetical protein
MNKQDFSKKDLLDRTKANIARLEEQLETNVLANTEQWAYAKGCLDVYKFFLKELRYFPDFVYAEEFTEE